MNSATTPATIAPASAPSRSRAARSIVILAAITLTALMGCLAPAPTTEPHPDPTVAEVPLPAPAGFNAYLVHQSDVGIWTVKCLPILERYGCPEIVALDDRGRCTLLISYSGKWTPWLAVQDGLWLGGITHADVDPGRPGNELYVGGQRGNLYQIWPHPQGGFDTNVIAYLPGNEIHTLIAENLDPTRPGTELLAFTRPGALYQLQPDPAPDNTFSCRRVDTLPGRVRDAAILRSPNGDTIGVATASRDGQLRLLQFDKSQPIWTTLYKTNSGLGRLAVRPPNPQRPIVLYVTCDDGRIVRLEQRRNGSFDSQIIFTGPQGPRGLAAGRFHEDPAVESVAIFGYDTHVQLLTRRDHEQWQAETIFQDTDKGHWLAVGEVDGRNATDELILSGYSARVVLLSRPPGYGIPKQREILP